MRLSTGGRSGVTLTELLVSMGIIALLIAIVMGVVGRAIESARGVACASHLHQLGAAYAMYAGANRGHTPSPARDEPRSPDDWIFWQANRDLDRSSLAPYLGMRGEAFRTMLRCPSAGESNRHTFHFNYSMNTGLWRVYWKGKPRLPLTQVRNPSGKALFYDEDQDADDGAFWFETASDNLTTRHHGKGNVAFFDGHVAPEPPAFAHVRASNDPTY